MRRRAPGLRALAALALVCSATGSERVLAARPGAPGAFGSEAFLDAFRLSHARAWVEDERVAAGRCAAHAARLREGPRVRAAGAPLPVNVSWQALLPDVKYQGPCGVCWAFVTTSLLEFRLSKDLGVAPVSLSEQNLIDCNRLGVNEGCAGGNFYSALSGNRATFLGAERYPFFFSVAVQEQRHALSPSERGAFCAEQYGQAQVSALANPERPEAFLKWVDPLTEDNLKEIVATQGVVAVAISGYNRGFMSYSGGVLAPAACNTGEVDHAALIVGYGTTAGGQDYWLVRNSWSSLWGEQGHIRIARNVDRELYPLGACQLLYQANYLAPGSLRCAAFGGNAAACAALDNPRFCSAEEGCRNASYYADMFRADRERFFSGGSPSLSSAPPGGISAGAVVGIVAGLLLVLGLLALVAYRAKRDRLSDFFSGVSAAAAGPGGAVGDALGPVLEQPDGGDAEAPPP